MRAVYLGLCGSISLLLTACDPRFESTTQLCQTKLPTTQAISSYEVNTKTGDDSYKLYLEDLINSLKTTTPNRDGDTTLTTDEAAVINFVHAKIAEYLNYTTDDEGNVTKADNPIDYIESVMASTDEDEVILTFSEAKSTMATAIATDNAVCAYQNDQIVFQQETNTDGETQVINKTFADLDLTYIPTVFVDNVDVKVDQVFTLTFDTDPEDSNTDSQTYYSSISRYEPPKNFKAEGYAQANVRQLSISKEGDFQSFFFDDDYDTSLTSILQITESNEFCQDENRAAIDCDENANIRTPQHPNCAGSEEDPDITDESKQFAIHNFSIPGAGSDFTDIKRFRIEVDYETSVMNVFVSKFNTAIVKANDENGNPITNQTSPNASTDLIENYTSCESSAVSQERYENLLLVMTEDERTKEFPDGIPATIYTDPGFDKTYVLDNNGQRVDEDEDGEDDLIENPDPAPILSFNLPDITPRSSVAGN